MKRLHFLSTMVLAGLFITSNVFAGTRSFHGKWRCNVSGYEMELAPTSFGFKSRQLNTNVWQEYDEVYSDHFVDRSGNSFDWRDDAWHYQSANRDKKMVFRPFGGFDSQYGANTRPTGNYYEAYDDRNYDYGNSELLGIWHSQYGRNSMFIKSSGRKCVTVDKNNRNQWQDYRLTRKGDFKDRQGNVIRYIGRNRIEWTSHCGRYYDVYTRGRQYDRRNNTYNRYSNRGSGSRSSCTG